MLGAWGDVRVAVCVCLQLPYCVLFVVHCCAVWRLPAGQFGTLAGQSTLTAACPGLCTNAPAGSFCGAGAVNASGIPCPPGRFSPTNGTTTACAACAVGMYSGLGATVCLPSTLDPMERDGLVTLYVSTGGPTWFAPVVGWPTYTNTSNDPCYPTPWTGLTCTFSSVSPYSNIRCDVVGGGGEVWFKGKRLTRMGAVHGTFVGVWTFSLCVSACALRGNACVCCACVVCVVFTLFRGWGGGAAEHCVLDVQVVFISLTWPSPLQLPVPALVCLCVPLLDRQGHRSGFQGFDWHAAVELGQHEPAYVRVGGSPCVSSWAFGPVTSTCRERVRVCVTLCVCCNCPIFFVRLFCPKRGPGV